MPYCLRNAPAMFQDALNFILSGFWEKTGFVYFAGIFDCSKNEREHVMRTGQVQKLLRRASITLKLNTRLFFEKKVEYESSVHKRGRLPVTARNVNAIKTFVFPTDSTHMMHVINTEGSLQNFLDFVNHSFSVYQRTRN